MKNSIATPCSEHLNAFPAPPPQPQISAVLLPSREALAAEPAAAAVDPLAVSRYLAYLISSSAARSALPPPPPAPLPAVTVDNRRVKKAPMGEVLSEGSLSGADPEILQVRPVREGRRYLLWRKITG